MSLTTRKSLKLQLAFRCGSKLTELLKLRSHQNWVLNWIQDTNWTLVAPHFPWVLWKASFWSIQHRTLQRILAPPQSSMRLSVCIDPRPHMLLLSSCIFLDCPLWSLLAALGSVVLVLRIESYLCLFIRCNGAIFCNVVLSLRSLNRTQQLDCSMHIPIDLSESDWSTSFYWLFLSFVFDNDNND